MNPYLMQMVNLREQCSWVHEDKAAATRKAASLIQAGLHRLRKHDPLEQASMEAESAVLVLGAGVAGIEAALVAAQKGRKVYIVEKDPCLGGHANRYEEVFPAMECGSCMLEPKLDELLHNEDITVLPHSVLKDVVGFHGNFTATVLKKARYVDANACFGCDECMKACPVKGITDDFAEGLQTRSAIYIPYPGALPNVALIDTDHCLRFKGDQCTACADACPFGAVDFTQKDEELELPVGAFVLATGFTTFDAGKIPQLGYGTVPEVYDGLEFEALLNSGGPTGGEIRMKNGEVPRSIAFIHCVGSRSEEHDDYCSGTCCMYTMKFAHLAHAKLPNAEIIDIHSHLSIAGKGYYELLRKVTSEGMEIVRTVNPSKIRVREGDGTRVVEVPHGMGTRRITADMVVLSTAMEPSADAQRLAELFEVDLDSYGFVQEGHGRLGAVTTNIEGVYAAGSVRAPGDIQAAVTEGAAASGKILHSLIPGQKIDLESRVAWSDPDRCGGCKMCVSMCPYKAIHYDPVEKVSTVNQALCHGCGTCVSACPGGAMESRHFSNGQIFAEIEGLLA